GSGMWGGGGDPPYEHLNDIAARVVGGIDRIKTVARKSKIERLDQSARGKVVGDDNIAAQCDALACENRLDRMQLFAETQRDVASLPCAWIADRRHLEPSLPIGRRRIIGEPIKMDERIALEIGGVVDARSSGEQLWAAHGIELIAKNLVRCAV